MINFYPHFFHLAKKFDPEIIHDITISLLKFFPTISSFFSCAPTSPVRGHHLNWNNAFGIAAGLDKNADALPFWKNLNLGCIEVGTVTPCAQYGNPKPRIKRIDPMSLHNSMGFPGKGSQYVVKNLMFFNTFINTGQYKTPVYVNIGKQKDTALTDAFKDYNGLIEKFIPYCDGLVVNISSPNTKDLRQLQSKEFLTEFLHQLSSVRNNFSVNFPLILKISPNESSTFYQDLPALLKRYNWQAIVATNTSNQHEFGNGGVSGLRLFETSYNIAKELSFECHHNQLDYIFAGGLMSLEQLIKLRELNIKFFQIYTALVYKGPSIFQELSSK